MLLDKVRNNQSYINSRPIFAKAFAYLEDYLKNLSAFGSMNATGKTRIKRLYSR